MKFAILGIVFFCVVAMVLTNSLMVSGTSEYPHLSTVESEIVSRINGTNIYNYDLQLENIALNQSLSLYTFRSSGSVGANETADWIQAQFESLGLETARESFEFTTWNLLTQPTLVIYSDGGLNATNSQLTISSFQCEHYSWPTSGGGVNTSLVILPSKYEAIPWRAVNTTGKVLLVPGEVQSVSETQFRGKILDEPPAAIIFTASSDSPVVISPHGGMDFWNLKIPVGWVNYDDGLLMSGRLAEENVTAFVSIPAVIGQGPHYNIVAKLPGSVNPQKMIIISAHYDSDMNAGFCSDGSGTAAVIELAKVFSEAAREGIYKPQYTLVFIAFDGEEVGFAGSVNYVKQHASEMGNIAAVINLDSLGSGTMEVTRTFPDDNGLNLQSIVTSAASDLGLTVGVSGTGGSDQQTFRIPLVADNLYSSLPNDTTSGIGSVTGVESSIMISSSPLDWINTENDNSSTPGWVTAANLQSQTQAAGLSVMRVLSTIFSPFLEELFGSLTAVGVAFAAGVYLLRSRLRVLFGGFVHEVQSLIAGKEVMYIFILTSLSLLVSLMLRSVTEATEIMVNGYPAILLTRCFGIPFNLIGLQEAEISEGGPVPMQITGQTVFLSGLVDIALFLAVVFLIVLAVKKVIYTRELKKYYSQQG